MSQFSLDEILACPSLPSLPAVAVRLLELTSDPDVSLRDIAKLVQQDQAMAAKVLKTVNSSFYGLSTPCSSIERAMGYLGLNTVKSLVLGFSLVETTKDADESFDMEAHWRRAILGATGARIIAQKVGGLDPEDAFTASLFQDMGGLALFVTYKEQYAEGIAGVPHRSLCKQERDTFGLTHAEVGSALASKWKLPPEITDAIKFHHDPDDCDTVNKQLTRIVAAGALICDCLDPDAPKSAISKLSRCSNQWFGNIDLDPSSLLEKVKETAETLAKMFGQEIGEMPSTTELMAAAQEKGLEHQLNMQREADELAREALIDGLTRIANRKRFDAELERVYSNYTSNGVDFGVLFFDADRFKSVNDTHGHAAGDAVLVELAQRTTEVVGDAGVAFRYGGEEFAVIVEGKDIEFCEQLGEKVREAFASKPFDLSAIDGVPDELPVTASIGVSSTDAGSASRLSSGDRIVHEADECVYAAKSAGRNNVKVFGRYSQVTVTTQTKDTEAPIGAVKAATDAQGPASIPMNEIGSTTPRILLVEDDALAATLVISLLKRRGKIEVEWVKTGTLACTMIEEGKLDNDRRPTVVLCDFNLPGCDGHEVLRVVRNHPQMKETPFYMLTGHTDNVMRDEAVRRGASKYVHKDEFCADVNKWLGEILDAGLSPAA